MTLRNLAHIAICIGMLSLLWLAAVQLAPFASASPAGQATVSAAIATATPQPPDSGGSQSYTVQSGDTLWSIATKFYGNGSKYPLILRANDMGDNQTLSVGVTLVIPAVTDTAPVALPKTSVPPTATPTRLSVAPSQLLPGGQGATPSALPTPTSLAVEAPPLSEPPKNAASTSTPLSTYLSLLIDVLSAICLLGSLTCAFLSVDAYRHSKRFVQRDYIRRRIRVKV